MKLLLLALLLLFPQFCFAIDAQVAFSPDRGATDSVVKSIENAKHSVHVAAYSFTSKPIAADLPVAHRRGIDVDVVVDKSNATARYTAATFLANEGGPMRVDTAMPSCTINSSS